MSLKLDFFYLYFSDQHKSPDFFQCVDICLPEVSFQSKSQKRINRKFHLKYTAWTKQNVSEVSCLGEGPATKSDEFLGKFQMAFDPPALIFGKLYCKFFLTYMVAYMQGDMMA